MATYELILPDYFDADAALIEAKGWFGDAVVTVDDGRKFALSFYDPTRLSQEIADELERNGLFSEPNLVVVSTVARQSIERAVAQLSDAGFATLIAS